MYYPEHIDGRTLVVIRRRKSLLGGYDVVESGVLHHDGEVLDLVGDHGSRGVSEAELDSLQPVVPQTRIAVCRGFDFFLWLPADAG